MPRGDGTGPMEQGAISGWGSGNTHQGQGRGRGGCRGQGGQGMGQGGQVRGQNGRRAQEDGGAAPASASVPTDSGAWTGPNGMPGTRPRQRHMRLHRYKNLT